jgi:hypothetical protein
MVELGTVDWREGIAKYMENIGIKYALVET